MIQVVKLDKLEKRYPTEDPVVKNTVECLWNMKSKLDQSRQSDSPENQQAIDESIDRLLQSIIGDRNRIGRLINPKYRFSDTDLMTHVNYRG